MARTTLDLDEEIIRKGMEVTGARSKKALIEQAVAELTRTRSREELMKSIEDGTFDLDFTLDDLWKMRGCDTAREMNEDHTRASNG